MYEHVHDFTSPIRLPNNLAQLVAVKMVEIEKRLPRYYDQGGETLRSVEVNGLPVSVRSRIHEALEVRTKLEALHLELEGLGVHVMSGLRPDTVWIRKTQEEIQNEQRVQKERRTEREAARKAAFEKLHTLVVELAKVQITAVRAKVPQQLLSQLDAI